MPRIRLNATEYRVRDFCSWVRVICKEMHITQKELGALMGVTSQRAGQKLATGHFTLTEIINILDKLEASDEEIIKLMRK